MNRPHRLLLPALLLAGLTLTGCSAGSDAGSDAGAADGAAGDAVAADAPRDEAREAGAGDAASKGMVDATPARSAPDQLRQPEVIQTGSLTVESGDVARARFDLGKVVDEHDGRIADEKTTASSAGEVRLSRLVLRIPSGSFDEAMTDLAGLGKVTEETRKAQDVTSEVIDTEARVRAQEQSLARVEVLFARADKIRDIVAIEAQLSRRQAELDSLKGQLAYLEDQTTYSTITVYLEQAPEPRATSDQDDDTAFVAGLKDGWGALGALGSGAATVSGALLPFASSALLLGVPVFLVSRRWLARHPVRRPVSEP